MLPERELYEIKPKTDGGWTVSQSWASCLREFRLGRIQHIGGNETGATALDDGPLVILHFVPHASLDGQLSVSLTGLTNRTSGLSPLGSNGWNRRYNADGFVTYSQGVADNRSSAYLQFFRNGIIETASTHLSGTQEGKAYIASGTFEDELIAATTQCLGLAVVLELPSPWSLCISVARIRGAVMAVDNAGFRSRVTNVIEVDTLLAPPVLLEEGDIDVASALRPAFDFFWQAAGWEGSRNYDASGTRRRA